MKGRLQCTPDEELKVSDCNKVIWILSSHVHLCMIISVDCTYLWWLIGDWMVLFHFLGQIFRLLKVDLEFRFHIFNPFKQQFQEVDWIINKLHRAYNLKIKRNKSFWLCTDLTPPTLSWQCTSVQRLAAGERWCCRSRTEPLCTSQGICC